MTYSIQDVKETLNQSKKIFIMRTQVIKEGSLSFPVTKVTSPEEAAQIARPLLQNKAVEMLYALFLTTAGNPLGIQQMAIGSVNQCIVPLREILQSAFLCNASSVILFHNHISDDVTPSAEDIMVTKRLQEAMQLLDLKLLDHIIISNFNENHASLLELGHIKEERRLNYDKRTIL